MTSHLLPFSAGKATLYFNNKIHHQQYQLSTKKSTSKEALYLPPQQIKKSERLDSGFSQ